MNDKRITACSLNRGNKVNQFFITFHVINTNTPQVVAQCVDAMKQASDLPITLKSRIGVDDMESYEELINFVTTVERAGCDTFIIHARKAWLKGLSPKENRTVPPLNYDWVYQIK
ncbi:MAG: hypothetical protein DSZ15_01260, partial [Candidatus Thioglobus sp.]